MSFSRELHQGWNSWDQLVQEDLQENLPLTPYALHLTVFWRVGQRIGKDILKEERADYGEKIVSTLSTQLVKEFGTGFAEKNLRRMVQFAEVFPDEQIVVTLSRQLGWSHFVAIIPLDDGLKRDFYAEMARIERWSVRTLRQKISGMLFALG